MKKCNFCAEEIQDEAIKCKHCGSMLDNKPNIKWYYKTSTLIVAFLCVGPLALPLFWINPRFSKKNKLTTSILIIIASIYLGFLFIEAIKSLSNYYKLIFQGI